MRIMVAIALVLSALASSADAEQLNRFDRKVILRSVQCEMGRAAAADEVTEAVKDHPAVIGVGSVEIAEYTAQEIGTADKFFTFIGFEAKKTDELTTGYTIPFHYNLHAANQQACGDKNIAWVGIRDCVVTNADRFQEYWTIGEPFTCRQEGSGTKFGKAEIGGEYWVVNASVNGSYTQKLSYKLTMTVPGAAKQPVPTALPSQVGTPAFAAARGIGVVSPAFQADAMARRSRVSRGTAYAQASSHRRSAPLNVAGSSQHQKVALW